MQAICDKRLNDGVQLLYMSSGIFLKQCISNSVVTLKLNGLFEYLSKKPETSFLLWIFIMNQSSKNILEVFSIPVSVEKSFYNK